MQCVWMLVVEADAFGISYDCVLRNVLTYVYMYVHVHVHHVHFSSFIPCNKKAPVNNKANG